MSEKKDRFAGVSDRALELGLEVAQLGGFRRTPSLLGEDAWDYLRELQLANLAREGFWIPKHAAEAIRIELEYRRNTALIERVYPNSSAEGLGKEPASVDSPYLTKGSVVEVRNMDSEFYGLRGHVTRFDEYDGCPWVQTQYGEMRFMRPSLLKVAPAEDEKERKESDSWDWKRDCLEKPENPTPAREPAAAELTPGGEEWIEWNGAGGRPVPGKVRIKAQLKGGTTVHGPAQNFYWHHDGLAGDIVAYRVLDKLSEPTKEETATEPDSFGGFKIGDKVRIVNDKSHWAGCEAEVISLHPYGMYPIKVGLHGESIFKAEDLEHVPNPADPVSTPTTHQFANGDEVMVKHGNFGGCFGRIERIDRLANFAFVELNDKSLGWEWFHESDLIPKKQADTDAAAMVSQQQQSSD